MATLEVFFREPTAAHYLMDISRRIGFAHTSVKKNLALLVKSGLILESIERRGSRKYPLYKAHQDDVNFQPQKMMYNINAIIESELIEYIENAASPKCIALFGSYRRGQDIEDSDIDLFLQCPTTKIMLSKFERKLQRKIELHFNEEFSSYPEELRNNVINGFVLSGYLKAYDEKQNTTRSTKSKVTRQHGEGHT